ncbi:MAG: PAS domain S-box protein [Syntrophobacteraceae bacterium]
MQDEEKTREQLMIELHELREQIAGFEKDKAERNLTEEHCVLNKDGNYKWVLDRGTVIKWADDGKPLRMIGTHTDITDRKRMEEELRQSEQKYRDIFNATSDALFIHDMTGRLLDVNERMCAMFEYDRATALGVSLKDISLGVPPYSEAEGFEKVRRSIEEGPQVFEWQSRRCSGEIFWSEVALRAYRSNGEMRVVASVRDITDRKQVEGALRESETKFRTLVEEMPDAITYISSLDENISPVYVSPQVEKILGYPARWFMQDPRAWLDCIHPDDYERVMTQVNLCLKTGQQFVSEYRVIRKDGQVAWIHDLATLMWDENGRPTSLLGVSIDITRRKRLEEKLRESEVMYRSIFENATEGIFQTTLEGRYLAVNPAFVRMFGYTSQEEMITNITNIGQQVYVHPEDRDRLKALAADEGRVEGFEAQVYRRDGCIIWISINIRAVRDETGAILFYQGTNENITERKQMEESLRKAEEKYRGIFENAAEGIYQSLPSGRFAEVNPTFARMFGYDSPAELKNAINNIGQKLYADPSVRDECIRKLQEEDAAVFEIEIRRKDGSTAWVSDNIRAVRDSHGEIILIEGIVEDITDRKRMEEEHLKVQKLESIGILAGGMAHDFNNILTAITGYIDIAKMRVNPGERVYQNLEQAGNSCLRAAELAKQLITFSKAGEPRLEVIALGTLLQVSSEPALRDSNVRCTVSFPNDLWPVSADEGQMKQVVRHLVMNAREAMPAGGEITIRAVNRIVAEHDGLPLSYGAYVEWSVTDHGKGIPKENLLRIFDPYFTTKGMGSTKGTGLGLSICYSIIKKHNGLITVASEPGFETTVTIYLPAAQCR